MKSSRITTAALAAATGAAATLIAAWTLGVRPRWLSVPWWYEGDSLATSMSIKNVLETGEYLYNGRVGTPTGLHMHDFNTGDSGHFLIFQILGWLGLNWVQALHAYYLLGFALAAIALFVVLKQIGVSATTAAATGILYALLPMHFVRGEMQVALCAYYTVPFACLLALRILEGVRMGRRETTLWLVGCAFIGLTGIYYAFFSCFFLLVAGLLGTYQRRNREALLTAGVFISAICLALLANMVPSILFWRASGGNPSSASRAIWMSELYGLKIAQLILPSSWHRIVPLAVLKSVYNQSPFLSENDGSSLGTVGAVGFVVLLVAVFFSPKREGVMHRLAVLNGAGVVLGTVGGAGVIFALLVSPLIRAWNRISVFIAVFALAATGLLLDRAIDWLQARVPQRLGALKPVLRLVTLAAVLAIGVYDQTSLQFRRPIATIASNFANDESYVAQLEAMLPPGSMIFQLPYIAFPEGTATHEGMFDYDHFRPYLHSRTLKWSYGAMRGRKGDHFTITVSSEPLPSMLDTLALAGFAGISLDRAGYASGDKTESTLKEQLGPPLANPSGRHAFFDLRPRIKTLREKLGEAKSRELSARVLDSPGVLISDKLRAAVDLRRLVPGEGGSVDALAPQEPHLDSIIVAQGWAADIAGHHPAKGVVVVADGKVVQVHEGTGIGRPDVARAYKNEEMLRTGWTLSLDVKSLGRGKHGLRFFALLEGEKLVPLRFRGQEVAVVEVR